MASLLDQIPALLLSAVEANPLVGYGAIVLVMLLENVVPPIPSEVVMPLAGFLIQQGKLQLLPTVLAGLLGTVLGAWFWYGIGRIINEKRLEH
jgi:membrane protein DedA with SNARE-associated domain